MTTGRFDFKRHLGVYPGFRALKLPYKNDGDDHRAPPQDAFYMLILLPDRNSATPGSLADLYCTYDQARGRDAGVCQEPHARPQMRSLPGARFVVPKFKFTFEFEASDDMQKLGVARAFGGGARLLARPR
jgi:serpin B